MFTIIVMVLLAVAKETVPAITFGESPLAIICILIMGLMYDIAFISRIVLKE